MGRHSAPASRARVIAVASAVATFLGLGSAAAYMALPPSSAPEPSPSPETTGQMQAVADEPSPVSPWAFPKAVPVVRASPTATRSHAASVHRKVTVAPKVVPKPVVRVSPAAPKPSPKPVRTAAPAPKPVSASKVSQLLAFLHAQVGKAYVYGGTGPDAFDCSGLVQAAYASIGVGLPRTSEDQASSGVPVTGPLEPGDILVTHDEGHDAVYIGGGMYIGAENSSEGIRILPLSWDGPYFARRIL